MPNKIGRDVRELAGEYGPRAVATLGNIMDDGEAPHAARVAASKEILDRAYGKSVQPMEIGGNGVLNIQINIGG